MSDSTPELDARPLAPILSPRSVAVVGASRRRDSIGYALLHNLILGEFDGPIYPVNPKARVVHSLRAYPSVSDIPDPVDLAVVLVPRNGVLSVVKECMAHGIRGIVVISAGFAETGAEGAAIEADIRDAVREAGGRMVGPNCMGVINTHGTVQLNATFAPTPAQAGSVGFVSQSGALGVAILNEADALGIGFTQFISMGNKADVSANDLLEHWEDDPDTHVIAMYLESFGNPRRFTEIARRVSRKKPILLVKSGRTAQGAKAASSHTGALAGADIPVTAFLRHCGVIRVNTVDELFDAAKALDRCPLPKGNRVAIVTNAGGPGIMATDACVNLGLEIVKLSDATEATLRDALPAEATHVNPVDMIASADAPVYRRNLETVLRDDNVDMMLAIHVTPLPVEPRDVLDAIEEAAAAVPDKPVLCVMMTTTEFYDGIRGRQDELPVYHFPESAAQALRVLARYGTWRHAPEGTPVPDFPVDRDRVRDILDRSEPGYLSPEDAYHVLSAYGIPTARFRMADTAEAVTEVAKTLRYPLVVKAVGKELVHKSDVGGVAVDLRSESELRDAVGAMTDRLAEAGVAAEGFLVQEFMREGHEVIFGVSTDPRFGPLIMFGLGGKYVEVFKDVRFAVPPETRQEAHDLLRGIRGFKLLEGVRGEEPADLEILEDVLLRLSQMVREHPRITDLDMNPFLATPRADRARAVDVRIRIS